MKITNKWGLPDTIVRAAKADDYSRGAARKSVTQLINSPKIDILRRQHYSKLTTDVSDMVWQLLGKGVHAILEKGVTEEHISEERLFMEIDGWLISGALDVQHMPEGIVLDSGKKPIRIQDYKVCSYYSVKEPKDAWEQQQNIYAELVEQVKPDCEVISLQIIAIIRDWSRSMAKRDKTYPQSPILPIDLPLWDRDRRMDYIRQRVRVHQEAEISAQLGEELPECDYSDMWTSETTFAVKKEGAKRAKSVHTDFLEASDFVAANPGYQVEVRHGDRVRCSGNYCGVADFCEQYRRYKEETGTLNPMDEI